MRTWWIVLPAMVLAGACGSSAKNAAPDPAPSDAVDDQGQAGQDAAANDATPANDGQTSDVAAGTDAGAGQDAGGGQDAATTGDADASVETASGGSDATGAADAGGCSLTPVSANYTATNVTGTKPLAATAWSATAVGGGATYTKLLKQVVLTALTGAGPGKTAPCVQLNVSLTLKGEPVAGQEYPVGLGADTANVDLTEFAGCSVTGSTNWNAAMVNPKAGKVKLVTWDGKSAAVTFDGVNLATGVKDAGTFTLAGGISTDCVKTQ